MVEGDDEKKNIDLTKFNIAPNLINLLKKKSIEIEESVNNLIPVNYGNYEEFLETYIKITESTFSNYS